MKPINLLLTAGFLFGFAVTGLCEQEFKPWGDWKDKKDAAPAAPASSEPAKEAKQAPPTPPPADNAAQKDSVPADKEKANENKAEAPAGAAAEATTGEENVKKGPKEVSELQAAKKEIMESLPLLEIKRLESAQPLYSIELRGVDLNDLFRVLAHDYDFNILVDKNVSGKLSASFTNISLEEALERIADMQGLIIEKKGSVLLVKPNLVTKVFPLQYVEAKTFVTGGTPQATALAGLLSKEGKSFLGDQPNSIMIIDYPVNLEKIESYLTMADKSIDAKVFKLKFLNAKDVVGVAK
jgi:type II secretory pathway component HofQ